MADNATAGSTAQNSDLRNGVTHIVWDWNGTLLNDTDANLASVNRLCAEFGRDPVDLDYWRSIFRRPLIPCYEELLGRPLTDGDWQRIDTTYHDHYKGLLPSCDLADGVLEVLRAWNAGGGTQSLLSMASHDHLVPLIADRGLTEHFTRVDGRRYDAEHDSKAEHLVEHLRAQDADPAATVLIGDIDDDAHAATAAGAHAILVATGMMSRTRLEATGHPVAETPAEAVAMLYR
ncbi:phosphoglycolate phosphatase-like HAD superfamily hydrolase [Spinactinospora alkalitolerans]|uniref:Phosphoglycolate phosphatase-like HAD superfamily hydrolase n=1 Tax=Spinactinospora alkalitolerans TaxID=687207 RepID=A0A852U434_9ACTN|nr:HAD hydrolase-like protein [Spinactinospora alkalitolerans]NYE48864.1 phosphoglycolate phosphatase-like HAD superfamily hydrolase [Spinactinospora alkalitolerans]